MFFIEIQGLKIFEKMSRFCSVFLRSILFSKCQLAMFLLKLKIILVYPNFVLLLEFQEVSAIFSLIFLMFFMFMENFRKLYCAFNLKIVRRVFCAFGAVVRPMLETTDLGCSIPVGI